MRANFKGFITLEDTLVGRKALKYTKNKNIKSLHYLWRYIDWSQSLEIHKEKTLKACNTLENISVGHKASKHTKSNTLKPCITEEDTLVGRQALKYTKNKTSKPCITLRNTSVGRKALKHPQNIILKLEYSVSESIRIRWKNAWISVVILVIYNSPAEVLRDFLKLYSCWATPPGSCCCCVRALLPNDWTGCFPCIIFRTNHLHSN